VLQVHEKSILLPLLPVTLLAAADPDSALWVPVIAAFQMYPLLERDGAAGVYFAANFIFLVVASAFQPGRERKGKQHRLRDFWDRYQAVLLGAGCLGALGLHVLRLLPAPASLPWLWDRLHVTAAFVPIAAHMVYTNVWQWKQGVAFRPKGSTGSEIVKKQS
jgi:alpha-1,3-glucosyltransferase